MNGPFARIVANAIGVPDFELVDDAKKIEFLNALCLAHDALAEAGYGDYGVATRERVYFGPRPRGTQPDCVADAEWAIIVREAGNPSMSLRALGRRIGFSHTAVTKWVKELREVQA
jgi:hypothetical protein